MARRKTGAANRQYNRKHSASNRPAGSIDRGSRPGKQNRSQIAHMGALRKGRGIKFKAPGLI